MEKSIVMALPVRRAELILRQSRKYNEEINTRIFKINETLKTTSVFPIVLASSLFGEGVVLEAVLSAFRSADWTVDVDLVTECTVTLR